MISYLLEENKLSRILEASLAPANRGGDVKVDLNGRKCRLHHSNGEENGDVGKWAVSSGW